jgi:hypothetical protein
VRNIRSRGLLIKGSNATIKNCSLINIGMSAIAIHYEIQWAESGVTENLEVKNNLIQHTGYFKNQDIYSPISIYGLGTQAAEDFLLYKNISITGNHIVDRTTTYALYINSAKDITVAGNDFGCRMGYTVNNDLSPAVHIYCAKDLEFNDNIYPANATSDSQRIYSTNATLIYGTDLAAGTSVAEGTVEKLTELGPTLDTSSGTVTYPGRFTFGSMPKSSFSFKQFTRHGLDWVFDDSISAAGGIWGGRGGIRTKNVDFRMAAQNNYNVAICYTVPWKCTEINVSLENLLRPVAEGTNGTSNGLIAIFQNGTMIWPKAGGSYTSAADWYEVSTASSPNAIKASIAQALTGLSVQGGDQIYFVSRQITGWSNLAMHPVITIVKNKE